MSSNQAVTDLGQIALHLTRLLASLNTEKEKALQGDLAGLLAFYWAFKETYKSLDEARKAIYAEVDFLDKNAIPEKLDASGMDKVRVPALGRSFYILPKYSASILDGKKDEAFEWLRSNGAGEVITETVNAGTLAALLRNLIEKHNTDAPEDIFKLTSYKTVGSSKYSPKGEK